MKVLLFLLFLPITLPIYVVLQIFRFMGLSSFLDNTFDLNRDGKIDSFERAMEFKFLEHMDEDRW